MRLCRLRSGGEIWMPVGLSTTASSRPACNAALGKNQETFSPTSRAHPAQTIRAPGPAPKSPSARVRPARATSLQTAAPARVRTPHAHRSRCRSPRPCRRISPRCANNSRVRDRTGIAPCSAKREWARAPEFPARFSAGDSQAALAPVHAILRRADEHLDQVVVQRVIELPLKLPLKLRVVEIAGMHFVHVGVDGHRAMHELDADFDAFALRSRVEAQQRMLVETQLGEHAVEAGTHGLGHEGIVMAWWEARGS